MKKFIYYPNLEPPDKEWLKFATLYLDNFESIVPYQRRYLISDEYELLSKETDLVSMYSPDYNEGERASLRAIDEAEKFINKPYQRSNLFNRVNLLRDWRNQDNWNYQIYSEKFSYQWAEYCIDKGIGRRNADGLRLPKELAFLFMTHLVKEISYERDGSIITDNIEYDNYTNFQRVHNPRSNTRHKFLMGLLNLLIPLNISEISFNKLIEFRTKNRERIRAFNLQVDIVEEAIGSGITERQFIESFNNAYSDLTKEIVLMGIGIASIPLAAYVLIKNPDALQAEYAKEILGALGLGLGGTFALKRSFYDGREKRMCKKYLTNLQKLR